MFDCFNFFDIFDEYYIFDISDFLGLVNESRPSEKIDGKGTTCYIQHTYNTIRVLD